VAAGKWYLSRHFFVFVSNFQTTPLHFVSLHKLKDQNDITVSGQLNDFEPFIAWVSFPAGSFVGV